ncbi:MAG: hypothetical protein QME96_09680 [Myxococcota bacterium]|nr:hypothetical protein [Myxococcota bacterium]
MVPCDRRGRRDPGGGRAPAPGLPDGWEEVVSASEAKLTAARAAEPAVGDALDHPALGRLQVVRVDGRRIEVRDRVRRLLKLSTDCLDFRVASSGPGPRVLDVLVRRE